jgi:hypothetical protein
VVAATMLGEEMNSAPKLNLKVGFLAARILRVAVDSSERVVRRPGQIRFKWECFTTNQIRGRFAPATC